MVIMKEKNVVVSQARHVYPFTPQSINLIMLHKLKLLLQNSSIKCLACEISLAVIVVNFRQKRLITICDMFL